MMAEAGAERVQAAWPTGFRADINGLRALSVIAVVAYHFDRSLVPGGFLGVDVFFVISGFLMTAIIAGRLERGTFGLGAFYGDRARRIVPALTAMCAAAVVVGAVALDPMTYERLAADVPSAVLFVSNFVFASRAGYFAPAAETEWLLHTWSLSVEWQFYLTYPVLLLLIAKVPALSRRLGLWLAVGAAASFAGGVIAGHAQPGWVFYMEPTRAWELLAGGLCALAGPKLRLGPWARRALHGAGLALIGLSLLLLNDDHAWPSPWTAVPVAGAAMVVLAGLGNALWARWPPTAMLGRSSYSTYIWHWPVIVAMRYAEIPFTPAAMAAGAALCFALGLASYWLIERGLTSAIGALDGRVRWAAGLGSVVAVAALGWSAGASYGFEAVRTAGLPPSVRAALADDRAARNDWSFERECRVIDKDQGEALCRLGDPAARKVLVIGDSHAEMLAQRYVGAFHGAGDGLTFLVRGGCPPIPGLSLTASGLACADWSAGAYRYAERSDYQRIVIASAWPFYFQPASKTHGSPICFVSADRCAAFDDPAAFRRASDAAFQRLQAELGRLKAAGKQVVVIGPFPTGGLADPELLYRRAFWTSDLNPPPNSRAAFERRVAYARAGVMSASKAAGALYIDPLDALCPAGLCPVAANGRPLYKDDRHYRASALADPSFAFLDAWLHP